MNSTTLHWNSAPRATAKTASAARDGARSAAPTALLRDDVGVEPLLPRRERGGADLVVHDVAAFLPLRRRREHARLAAQRRGHRRLHVGGARLERGHQLLLDLLRQREIDELAPPPPSSLPPPRRRAR